MRWAFRDLPILFKTRFDIGYGDPMVFGTRPNGTVRRRKTRVSKAATVNPECIWSYGCTKVHRDTTGRTKVKIYGPAGSTLPFIFPGLPVYAFQLAIVKECSDLKRATTSFLTIFTVTHIYNVGVTFNRNRKLSTNACRFSLHNQSSCSN